MNLSTAKLRPSALRNLSTVSLHKAAQVVGQMVAVFTIPRLLGADDHGRFAFVLSYAYLAQVLGDLGTLEVMSRFVSGLSPAETRQLYTRTLLFKTLVGLLCGLLATGLVMLLSPWMRLEWAMLIGLGVMMHIIAWVPFQLLLGLNRVGLWMVEQSWRQWVLIILIWILYPWLGVGGSILAWTVMEFFFFVVGLWWAAPYWQSSEWRLRGEFLRPYVRFGLGFFLANLVSAVLYRSAPVMMETLTGEVAEAGYANLAIGLFLMSYLFLTQFSQSLVPTLTNLYNQQRTAEMGRWIKNFVNYSWLLGWLAVVGVWLVADWGVLFAFGPDYANAAPALKWISLGIPLSGPLWAGNAIATVVGRGRIRFGATLVALLVFLSTAFWLIPLYAAAGASMAMSMAVGANMLVLTIFLRPHLRIGWPLLLSSAAVGLLGVWVIEAYHLSILNWGIF